ncbi:MAG TPA: hypothetical protein VIY51_00330 [Xanthobacteraceae bacterium]
MSDEDPDHAAAVFLRNEEMNHLQDYLGRGRPLEKVESQELNRRWVACIKARAAAVTTGTPIANKERVDIACELELRGSDLPTEEVRAEMEVLRAAAISAMDDPVKRKRVEDSLIEDAIELFSAKRN